MNQTNVSVTFEKKVSDGNYGHESVAIFMGAELASEDNAVVAIASLTDQARTVAEMQLAKSPSLAVRRALERQEPRPTRSDEF